MQAVILAAGRGTRLKPLTLTRSKGMVPVVGVPMIGRVMERLQQAGVDDFVVVVHPEDGELQAYLAGPEMAALTGGKGVVSVEQTERLGMADALRQAAGEICGKFVLSACDSLKPVAHVERLVQRLAAGEAPGVLSLMMVPDELVERVGIVRLSDDQQMVTGIVEKPLLSEAPSRMASLPLYGFSDDILSFLPRVQLSKRGEYELQDAIQLLIDEVGILWGEITEERLDLTDVDNYLDLNRQFLAGGNLIEEGAEIGEGVTIGSNVYIESGAKVGEGVQLEDCAVLRTGVVGAGEAVEGKVVV